MNPRKDLTPQLAGLRGKAFWRTLEELADDAAFQELMRQEFPEQADVWPDQFSRRQFLTLMGASLALAGLSGCSVRPAASVKVAPYIRQPEQLIPGKPLFFATAMTMNGSAVGLLVESHLGRPTKVEGNPEHPASRGATDLYHQASVLSLYDPDRAQTVTVHGQTSTWDDAFGMPAVQNTRSIGDGIAEQRRRGGRGLRVLTETVVSPTLGQQLEDLLKEFPEAKWHQYEPIHRDHAYRAAQQAFGRAVSTHYDFTRADVVLSFDADFLSCGPGNLRYVADFMSRRRVRTDTADAGQARMNRLYAVETSVSNTGAKADHRLALRAQEMEGFARAVAARLGVPPGATAEAGPHARWIDAVAKDLEQHRGKCVVLAGDRQPPAVHLLAHALNQHLGNVGQTVFHTDPVEVRPTDQTASLGELVEDMDRGRVELLLILGGNPAFNAPADFRFVERMQKVPLRVYLGQQVDETARQCHWHLPEGHYLEAWGDARAYDGTASIVQPLIEPLYQGRSACEVLARFARPPFLSGYEVVRAYWRRHWDRRGGKGDFEQFWATAVHDGVVAGTQFPPRKVALREGWEKELAAAKTPAAAEGLEINFDADPTLFDGRFANNGWLQELPKPITKITWDNAAIMSPRTARRFGVEIKNQVGKINYAHGGEHGGYYVPVFTLELDDGRNVEAPVWVMPGHADDSVTVHLGHGREFAGRVGTKIGFDAYRLRTSEHPWTATGLRVRPTGRQYLVACTQAHQLMEGRDLVRAATLADYQKKPGFVAEHEHEPAPASEGKEAPRTPLTMYNPYDYSPPRHRWGMAIDLTACTGCKACVVACQAENNIPVVGKEQVAAGREMHWLRIDHYNRGEYDDPREFYFQPVPCMHCENAPCEYVCPVAATVHSADGLNEMVYQRCVGTRFCSNNCPYKVRRFNFFQYTDYATQSLRLQYNPDVTVRSRGVMEKCSYCVQRIRHAEIDAQREGRPIADGEILTACQAACPAQAIVFGDLNDPQSTVKQWKDTPLHYGLLAELNTAPRTTYLAALRNPNPDLEA